MLTLEAKNTDEERPAKLIAEEAPLVPAAYRYFQMKLPYSLYREVHLMSKGLEITKQQLVMRCLLSGLEYEREKYRAK